MKRSSFLIFLLLIGLQNTLAISDLPDPAKFPTKNPKELAKDISENQDPEDKATTAVTTESKKATQDIQQKIPPCPVTDANCHTDEAEQPSLTDAPTTRSKQEAFKIQQTTPSCHVSDPNCNVKRP